MIGDRHDGECQAPRLGVKRVRPPPHRVVDVPMTPELLGYEVVGRAGHVVLVDALLDELPRASGAVPADGVGQTPLIDPGAIRVNGAFTITV